MIIAGSILTGIGLILQIIFVESNLGRTYSYGSFLLAFTAFIFLFIPGIILLIIGLSLRNKKKNKSNNYIENKPSITLENKEENIGKITCKCGYEVQENFAFCPICGEPNNKSKKCSVCGKEVKEEYIWCPYCKNNLSANCCKNCGSEVDIKFDFCSHCGERINKD